MGYTEAGENYSSKQPSAYFKNHNDGTCELIINNFSGDELRIPELSLWGLRVIAIELKQRTTFKKIFIPKTLKFISFITAACYEVEIDPQNPYFSVFDGVVFDKEMKTLIYCPLGKTGKFIAPASVRTIKDSAFSYEDCNLREVVFQEGLKEVEEPCSLYGPKIVTLKL